MDPFINAGKSLQALTVWHCLSVYLRPSCRKSLQQDGHVPIGWGWQMGWCRPWLCWSRVLWGRTSTPHLPECVAKPAQPCCTVLEWCTEQITTAAHCRRWAGQSSSVCFTNQPSPVLLPSSSQCKSMLIKLKSRDQAKHWCSPKLPVIFL